MPTKFEIIVYYINGGKKLSIQELKQSYKEIPGFIKVFFFPDKQNMSIIDLNPRKQAKNMDHILWFTLVMKQKSAELLPSH